MEDPVVASDGHSYDRSNIQTWLRNNVFSPITREFMTTKLVNNMALRGDLEDPYMCPIGLTEMEDPVVASDGYSYDRVNIITWYNIAKISPMTRKPITGVLIDNIALRKHCYKPYNPPKLTNLIDKYKNRTTNLFGGRRNISNSTSFQLNQSQPNQSQPNQPQPNQPQSQYQPPINFGNKCELMFTVGDVVLFYVGVCLFVRTYRYHAKI